MRWRRRGLSRDCVLNAFRHHRGGHNGHWSAPITSPCAQRLSASQRWAFLDLPVSQPFHDVLNAFRHHRGGHARGPGDETCRSRVLNAFRHHRGGHRLRPRPLRRSTRCSTPFGITEVGIHGIEPRVDFLEWCSTPFGITEVGMPCNLRRCNPKRRVLNAFRHHRGGHKNPVQLPFQLDQGVLNAFRHHRGGHSTPGTRWARADAVLNAFRHHRGGHDRFRTWSGEPRECSTPFGITEVGIAGLAGLDPGVEVLNAFRHHRGGHGRTRTSGSRLRWVLNAFRHHRGGHRMKPFTGDRLYAVLNAFRHHRGGHSGAVLSAKSLMKCSTPFGITEVGIDIALILRPRRTRAQRLSASQRWASALWALSGAGTVCSTPFGITEVGIIGRSPRSPRKAPVLNAFRHHRGGHTAQVTREALKRWQGAQRLSASQRWASDADTAGRNCPGWCSTPFGITEVGMIAGTGTKDLGVVCSTPFGITEVGMWHAQLHACLLGRVLNAFRHHRGGHRRAQAAVQTSLAHVGQLVCR